MAHKPSGYTTLVKLRLMASNRSRVKCRDVLDVFMLLALNFYIIISVCTNE